jgi:hypothetical protein
MKNYPENGYNLSDLNELAIEADIYVNEPSKRKVKKSRIQEVIPMLDEVAGPLYLEQPVRIFGVHARSVFDKGSGGIKHYMSPGQVTGISEGFMAVDYDNWPDLFADEGNERHLRLIAELKERAVGSIGISHLLRRRIITVSRPDLLTSHHIINRAVAPVASSFLFPEIEQSLVMDEEQRLAEFARIMHVSSPKTAEKLDNIRLALLTGNDPLISLIDCSKDFYDLCNYGDHNAVSAAHDYMNIMTGPRFFGKVYRFNDLPPPSLVRSQGGPMEICQFNAIDHYDFLMVSLAIGRELEQKDNMLRTNQNNTLYAVARIYENGAVGSSQIFLPIDKLQNKNFTVINPQNEELPV